MESLLLDFSLQSNAIAYSILAIGVLIEGDATLLIASFLAFLGLFDPTKVFLIAGIGIAVRDSFWYWMGKKLSEKGGWISRWASGIAAPFDHHLISKTIHSLVVAKFVYGLHLAIIVRAGSIKMPIKKFASADLIAIIVWLVIVGGLGYVSSVSFFAVKQYLKFIEIILAIALLFYFGLHHFAARYSKKSFRD